MGNHTKNTNTSQPTEVDPDGVPKPKLKRKLYEAELAVLQVEMVALEQWVKATSAP